MKDWLVNKAKKICSQRIEISRFLAFSVNSCLMICPCYGSSIMWQSQLFYWSLRTIRSKPIQQADGVNVKRPSASKTIYNYLQSPRHVQFSCLSKTPPKNISTRFSNLKILFSILLATNSRRSRVSTAKLQNSTSINSLSSTTTVIDLSLVDKKGPNYANYAELFNYQ